MFIVKCAFDFYNIHLGIISFVELEKLLSNYRFVKVSISKHFPFQIFLLTSNVSSLMVYLSILGSHEIVYVIKNFIY